MKKVNIALLGFGNVGQGVWKILNTNKNEILLKCGYDVEVKKILVRDRNKPRNINAPQELITTNIEDILYDESIKIVVELMGGSQPAIEYMIKAMECKKNIVTANKLALAIEGQSLFETAQKEEVLFYYEASVGGGIPIIREINESLAANKIEKIVGIINGTTNYILTKMSSEGMDFEDALKEAQAKGYAEADPTSDIEGYDAAYKLSIMASLSFGTKVDFRSIYREGISKIKADDIKYANKFGYAIKLLAIGKEVSDKLELRVHPTMVPKTHPIANVNDVFNAIFIKGNAVGDLMLYGRGAGDLPTGSAVVGDIISILRNNVDVSAFTAIKKNLTSKEIQNSCENISGYYIRLDIKDQPGILGEVANILGMHNVSILTVSQDVNSDDSVSLILITHEALEGNIKKSLDNIKSLEKVNSIENVIRIESLK